MEEHELNVQNQAVVPRYGHHGEVGWRTPTSALSCISPGSQPQGGRAWGSFSTFQPTEGGEYHLGHCSTLPDPLLVPVMGRAWEDPSELRGSGANSRWDLGPDSGRGYLPSCQHPMETRDSLPGYCCPSPSPHWLRCGKRIPEQSPLPPVLWVPTPCAWRTGHTQVTSSLPEAASHDSKWLRIPCCGSSLRTVSNCPHYTTASPGSE